MLLLVLLTLTFAQPIAANSRTDKSTSYEEYSDSRFTDRYFRFGAMLNRSKSTRFKEIDCNASSPPAFIYGCGIGHNGNQRSSTGDFGSFGSLEFAVGYRPSPTIRRELSLHIHPNFKFRGNANYSTGRNFTRHQPVVVKGSAIALMYNHFLEFPLKSSGDSIASRITPFIGVGLGVSSLKLGQTTMILPNNDSFLPGGSHYDLAWMFAAGFSIPIEDKLTLDVALHYINLGETQTGKGDATFKYKNHISHLPDTDVEIHPTAATFSATGIQVSLRYGF